MKCPKCGQEQTDQETACIQCGIIFSKWQERLARIEAVRKQREDAPEIPIYTDHHEESEPDSDGWSRRGVRLGAILLLIGFAWPLLKHSLLLNSSVFVWPWDLMGDPDNPKLAAAIATISIKTHITVWAFLPLALGLIAFVIRNSKIKTRACISFIAGTSFLIASLIFLHRELEILGLHFLSFSSAAGVILFIGMSLVIMVSSGNHLRKSRHAHLCPRLLTGLGGFFLGLLVLFFVIASNGAWQSWSMWLLYIVVMCYAVLSTKSAFQSIPDESLLSKISFLSRVALWWLPLACLIAQATTKDPFVRFAIGAGGGFAHIFMSIFKATCLFYGSALLTAIGLTIAVEQWVPSSQQETFPHTALG